jgi:hypothetical protein
MSEGADRVAGRGNALILCFSLLALLAGVALLIIGGSIAVTVAGILLVGVAGIALVSLAFLLVGQGEDRDRMRRPQG